VGKSKTKKKIQKEKPGCNLILTTLLILIFLTAYFFIVTYFFQGLGKCKLYDTLPDLIFASISLYFLFYVHRCKKLVFKRIAKKQITWGLILVTLAKLIEIVIQEYQVIVGPLNRLLWYPRSLTLLFIGFMFILYSFRRVVKWLSQQFILSLQ